MSNKYRWQAPGNSNIFDCDISEYKNSYVTKRSILILEFIKNKPLVSIEDFENN